MDQEIMAQQLTDFSDVLNSGDQTNYKALTTEHNNSSTTESAMDIFTPQLVLDDKDVRTSSWFYDTPGLVSNDQVEGNIFCHKAIKLTVYNLYLSSEYDIHNNITYLYVLFENFL